MHYRQIICLIPWILLFLENFIPHAFLFRPRWSAYPAAIAARWQANMITCSKLRSEIWMNTMDLSSTKSRSCQMQEPFKVFLFCTKPKKKRLTGYCCQTAIQERKNNHTKNILWRIKILISFFAGCSFYFLPFILS